MKLLNKVLFISVNTMYKLDLVIIFTISFEIIYLHATPIKDDNLNSLENQLHPTKRLANIQACISPNIANGNVEILKQKLSPRRNYLFLNVTCDNNYIIYPPNEYTMSCINGFWDIDDVPQCIKCIQHNDTQEISIALPELDTELLPYYFCKEDDNSDTTECGQRTDQTHKTFIVNGTLTKSAEFPWHVGIFKKDANDSYPLYICGGTIIKENYILTVAHCFANHYGSTKNSREHYIAAGKFHSNYNSEEQTAQRRKVTRIILHPRYKGIYTNYAWDIAVVYVDEPFEISTVVQPVCIDWMTGFENEQLIPNNYGEIAGWGKTETNFDSASLELRVLKVPFINIQQCSTIVPSAFFRYITHDKFCAGYTNGSSVCDGDSGGGLVFERRENKDSRYYIRGIVSVGVTIINESRCDDYKYSAYTKVSEYLSFIKENIQSKVITTTPLSDSPTDQPVPTNTPSNLIVSVPCTTPNGEQAKCVSIHECKKFRNALQNSPTNDTIKFLKESQCDEQDENKICCGSTIFPLSIINSDPITEKPIIHRNLNLLPTPGVCGRQVHIPQSSAYKGNAAQLLDYPWLALLEYGTKEKSAGFFCEGFLINERYLLTAGHCGRTIHYAGNAQVFRVRLGEYNKQTTIDCVNLSEGTGLLPNETNCADPPLDIDVEEIIIHPLYSGKKDTNDITLLRLAKNVIYTDFIKPICLPLNEEKSQPGKQMTIAGWGCNFDEIDTIVKRNAVFPAMAKEVCEKIYRERHIFQLDTSHICVDSEPSPGFCIGNAGTPIMTTLTNSTDIYAEGVFSFGTSISVGAKISDFMEWILDNIRP